ncbi:MAG: hypothetical protein ACM3XN_11395 [Chloroflexota bacterium]
MADLARLAADLKREFAVNPRISAAGVFGSVSEADTWAHSDIDLFVITSAEDERWEGVYLRRAGVRVHLQVLSLAVLRKNAAVNKGGPFFTALAGVTVWFDRTGDLVKAVATARDFRSPATRIRACREFCPGIEALHLAEKYAIKGKLSDTRAALSTALVRLAAAALADAGVYPPRDIWASPLSAGLPEVEDLERLCGADEAELKTVIAGIWRRIRPELGRYCTPIIDVVRNEGPLPLRELDNGKRLPGIQIPERLLDELVSARLLTEVERHHEALGLEEVCYTVPIAA